MTWAKLDDGITDDPELLALDRSVRLVHLEGIVWSCRHLTDGHIPRHVIRKVTDHPEPTDAANQLVEAGLWQHNGDGWQIDGFLQDQLSSEEVEERRARWRTRQERRRKHKDGDHSMCSPKYCKYTSRVSHDDSHGGSHDTPSRPDPTRSQPGEGRGGTGRGSAEAAPPPGPSQKAPGFTLVDEVDQ